MESGSRRKQLRPARVNDPLTTASQNNTRKVDVTMDTIAQDQLNETLKTAMAKIGETRVKSEIDEDSGIEMRTGETRGPYPVKELRASSSEGENEVTIVDQLGNTHHFEVDSVDPILRRIKPCHNALESNCIVFHVESLIQILITKDLRSEDDLLPILIPQQQPSTASDADIEKRFLCTKCHIAKFNCYENLTAHQKFYCKGKDSLNSINCYYYYYYYYHHHDYSANSNVKLTSKPILHGWDPTTKCHTSTSCLSRSATTRHGSERCTVLNERRKDLYQLLWTYQKDGRKMMLVLGRLHQTLCQLNNIIAKMWSDQKISENLLERSHSELDAMKFEILLATHVAKVKAERKSPPEQMEED
uniref:C2H2-type domain-containing protein n=1 Tax=Heterorhabditis bacteriophora TaxID=37862 RepID=A0A1I7WTS8_HETBA